MFCVFGLVAVCVLVNKPGAPAEILVHHGAGSCLARAVTNFVTNNCAIWEPKRFVQFLYKSLPLYELFWPV